MRKNNESAGKSEYSSNNLSPTEEQQFEKFRKKQKILAEEYSSTNLLLSGAANKQ
ncbi:MAG: hypothetical protein AABX01_00975 [Candidatus Micrarchaeota archaeon]